MSFVVGQVLKRGMTNGYHTAKVEWIKDEPIPEEELGNQKIMTFITFVRE